MDLKSGYPFWLLKYGLPFNYSELQEDLSTEVVVMGAGISGALTAYSLVKAGVSCIVIDARPIGLGSTCASTSLLQYEIDVPLSELKNKIGLENAVSAYKLGVEAIDSLQQIANDIGYGDFETKKSLYYAARKKDDSFIKEEYLIRKENGLDVALLSEAEIDEMFQFKATSGILSAKAAQTNAYCFTHALHQFNIKNGCKVYERTEATDIMHNQKDVQLKIKNGYRLSCKKLVYATGYEAIKYVDKKIVDLNSTYAICSQPMLPQQMPQISDTLIWNTADPYLYMRTTIDNRIILGGRDEEFYNPEKRDKLLQKKQQQLEKDFLNIFPTAKFETAFSWTGTFGTTKDGLPFIGAYEKLPNSYFALGFGGNGITFSLLAAKYISELYLDPNKKIPKMFSFERLK